MKRRDFANNKEHPLLPTSPIIGCVLLKSHQQPDVKEAISSLQWSHNTTYIYWCLSSFIYHINSIMVFRSPFLVFQYSPTLFAPLKILNPKALGEISLGWIYDNQLLRHHTRADCGFLATLSWCGGCEIWSNAAYIIYQDNLQRYV